jgi:hypothetical protein
LILVSKIKGDEPSMSELNGDSMKRGSSLFVFVFKIVFECVLKLLN